MALEFACTLRARRKLSRIVGQLAYPQVHRPSRVNSFRISWSFQRGTRNPATPAGCHSLHSNHMLNRGHAYTTIITSKYHGRTLLSHLASLYPHSTPQAWQQNLNNCEVTVNGVTATGSESLISGQTLVWNRPPWIEPDTPQHFEVLFDDPHLLAVNKPGGLPTLPGGGFMENTLLRLVQKQTPTQTLSTG